MLLVVAGPQADYTPNEVTAIKNYVEGGGRAMILLDPPLDFGREHIAQNTALQILSKTGALPKTKIWFSNRIRSASFSTSAPRSRSLPATTRNRL